MSGAFAMEVAHWPDRANIFGAGCTLCAGFGWDRPNFLCSSQCGAVFWMYAGNRAGNSGMFSLLVSRACTESGLFLHLIPCHQGGG